MAKNTETAPPAEIIPTGEGWEEAESAGLSPEAARKLEAATGAYEVEIATTDAFTATGKPTRITIYMKTLNGAVRDFSLPGEPIGKATPGRFVQMGFIHPVQEVGAGTPSDAYAKMSLQARKMFEASLPNVKRVNYRTLQVQHTDGTIAPLVGQRLAVSWITGPDRNDEYGEASVFPLGMFPQLAADPPRRKAARVRKPAAGQGGAGGVGGAATGGAASTGQGSWG